ncbi:hypothetical protein [Paludisphaera mucosa]|uniref:Toxin co-regulated pilus biosynthesis protein Q C-terminal domain-containing protein n=1 Tax=Paludisphaera mucosa TaxID=3030827 RepID=A0ABT6FJG5_9BACT|nr:hypothetical protein [Paludisphaera mucosa]MDG3007718.1 hypothetical protein [Paludisphaera mucosa]
MSIPSRVGIGMAMLVAGVAVGRSTVADRGEAPAAGVASTAAVDPVPPRAWEATVHLPLADELGRPFTAEEWGEALEILVTRFGGATLAEPREGCWLDARRGVLREPIRPVAVSFAPHRLEEFRRAALDVGRHLGQEAVYVRFDEPRVELIPVRSARPGSGR